MASGIYYEQLLPRGFIKPEDQEPQLGGLDFYLDAFREIATCRPSGLDLQPIPFTAIVEYSRIYDIEDFDEFAHVIRDMDRVFLEMNKRTQKKEGAKDGSTDPGSKNPHQGRHGGSPPTK